MKLLVFLLCCVQVTNSQRIMFVGEKFKADFDVIYTTNINRADICINMVSYEYEAGRSTTRNGCDNWFVVDNEWQADYLVRNVNSVVPGRKTLYVYRNRSTHCDPPLRDRNDPRRNYEFDDSRYDDYYYHHYKPRIRTNINLDIKIR